MEGLEADDHLEAMVQVTPGKTLGPCDGHMHPKVFQREHLYQKIKDNNLLCEELHFMIGGLSFVTAQSTYFPQQHQTGSANNFKMHDPLHQQLS